MLETVLKQGVIEKATKLLKALLKNGPGNEILLHNKLLTSTTALINRLTDIKAGKIKMSDSKD